MPARPLPNRPRSPAQQARPARSGDGLLYIDPGYSGTPREPGTDFAAVAVPLGAVLSFTFEETVRRPDVKPV